jgi:UDP-3-O-[3-hydroxymyristoyl] glucosamine N-acyltransferase
MQLNTPVTLAELSKIINANYIGNSTHLITGINEIHMVQAGDLTFVDHPKYYDKALQSNATTIIINKDVECPAGKALLVSNDPFRDYNILTQKYRPVQESCASIATTATIGHGTVLRAGVVIGEHVTIGNNCTIHGNVVIYDHTVIGNNVEIHANAVLGADAFYFKKYADVGYTQMYSCGRVVIHNNVSIGALTTIDKGVSGDTVIGEGTKLDNHVHIGHDTIVGKNVLMAAHTAIAGVTTIEDDVILWGQVGVNKDLTIGKGAVVLAQSGVAGSIAGGKTYFGSPVQEAREKMKELALVKQLPYYIEKLRHIIAH